MPEVKREIKLAFDREAVTLPISELLPVHAVPDKLKLSNKYKVIAHSIAEVGVIEPLIVARSREGRHRYVLLDGHLRYTILVDAGVSDVRCLIATDDEAFTYNKRISRLATIQEHYMIVRAIKRGVSEEKLGRALNLDVKAIKRRRLMLASICPEVVEILKDKSVNPATFDVLRKMKPMRQVEVAELMGSAGNYTTSYAKALLAGTKQIDLVKSDQPKRVAGLTSEQMARMEREMETVERDLKLVEAQYGEDVLQLVIAGAYLAKLLANRNIKRYLTQQHPEILAEFTSIISAASLDQSGAG